MKIKLFTLSANRIRDINTIDKVLLLLAPRFELEAMRHEVFRGLVYGPFVAFLLRLEVLLLNRILSELLLAIRVN